MRESLTGEITQHFFMILACCRGNEVSIDHPLAEMLRELETVKVKIFEIEVKNLSQNSVMSMIANMPSEECLPLSKVVYGQAEGHALYTMQLLHTLQDKRLVNLDYKNRWTWDTDIMQKDFLAKDFDDLLLHSISVPIGQHGKGLENSLLSWN
jgi:predicted ATPase